MCEGSQPRRKRYRWRSGTQRGMRNVSQTGFYSSEENLTTLPGNVPAELTAWDQWLTWTYNDDKSKKPLVDASGQLGPGQGTSARVPAERQRR